MAVQSLSRVLAGVAGVTLRLNYWDASVSGDSSSGFWAASLIGRDLEEHHESLSECCRQPGGACDSGGTVRLSFVLGVEGTLTEIKDAGTDRSLQSILSCVLARFQKLTPMHPDGGPVKVILALPINFSERPDDP
jgi:hypothetical protein